MFYNKKIDYEHYIKECFGERECSICYKSDTEHIFQISYQGETVLIYFQQRSFPMEGVSELIFAQSVLKNIELGCLAYGIVTIKDRVTYLTNEVLSSKHDCVTDLYFCDYESPMQLANCIVDLKYCPLQPNNTCLYQSLNPPKCHCTLCVKNKPASLKSLCVNKIIEKKAVIFANV